MVRREKCRRPKTLIVDVMGSQVGVNGSAFTVCFLCLHKSKAQVIQLRDAGGSSLQPLTLLHSKQETFNEGKSALGTYMRIHAMIWHQPYLL